MHRVFYIIAFSLALAFSVCGQESKRSAVIHETVLLDSLPSGSGMAIDGDSLYIVGDDATEVFKTGLKASLFYRPIPMQGVGHLYRMPAIVKRDFEAAFIITLNGTQTLVAVPSGSMSPHRDSAFAMSLTDVRQQKSWNLYPLYKAIGRKAGIRRSQWNIEGAFASGGRIFLLNRATNHIISLPDSTFFNEDPSPDLLGMQGQAVVLPEISGVPAHFSDACILDGNRVLFSASVEDAPGVAADGPLLGSYVGILEMSESGIFHIAAIYPVAGPGGSGFTGKIEAVVPLPGRAGGAFDVLAVTDNDDGHSQLLRIRMPTLQD